MSERVTRLNPLGAWALPLLTLLAALAVYARTAAPTLLSGDSAEFQLAATTLGVAHPTTYPLYTMLGYLATRLIPFGDTAWRVTLVSALCAALALALCAALLRKLGISGRAAMIAVLLLGVSPGLWNAATIAEVYALLALLMFALGVLLAADASGSGPALFAAGIVSGLGFTHHGLFAVTALPVFAAYLAWRWFARPSERRRAILAVVAGGAGFAPWLYPLAVFARFGPFSGDDYGLPRHYFWGSPATFADVFDLLTGGAVRRGIFRLPSPESLHATIAMIGDRMRFEFGWIGILLGLIGLVAMLRTNRPAWACSAWVFLATLAYLVLLGPAVADAPVFTLPMLLPSAVWIAYGCDAILRGIERVIPAWRSWPSMAVFVVILALCLRWADTRVEYASKRSLTLYRTFGETTLAALPPDAVVIAHWEQGMVLQYLHLVERQRPDVWVDVVEPGDAPWEARARRRYPDRPVYLVGSALDVEHIPVEPVLEDDYASLFRLRSP